MHNRRIFLQGLIASGVVIGLPHRAWAGTHYAFVKFEANGSTIDGDTITDIGDEELPRGEWIQCKRVSYGLKRDIGTGGRVSGHTHYDRIEFDCAQGPSTPALLQMQSNKLSVNVKLHFYDNAEREGRPHTSLSGVGWLNKVSRADRKVSGVFYFSKPVDAELAAKVVELTSAR